MKPIYVALIALCITSPAMAKNYSGWFAEKARLEKLSSEGLSDEQRCQATWDILWPSAKKGTLEAREQLFFSTLTIPHNDVIRMPGRQGDFVSRLRDGTILAVHSSGVEIEKDVYVELVDGLFADLGLQETGFYKCFKEAPSADCAHVAVKEGLVPSFEDFADEMELFLAQGRRPTCFFTHPPE